MDLSSSILLRNWSRIDHEQQRVNILILGNDSYINRVDWNDVRSYLFANNAKILTAGVNRIYKIFMPDIFFFVDGNIGREMQQNRVSNLHNDSVWLSAGTVQDWYKAVQEDFSMDEQWYRDNNLQVIPRTKFSSLPKKSIIWLMHLLNTKVFPHYTCYFYTYGISLNLSTGYFWKDDSKVHWKKPPDDKMKVSLNAQLEGFRKLIQIGYNIFSLTPKSALNQYVPYVEKSVEEFIREF